MPKIVLTEQLFREWRNYALACQRSSIRIVNPADPIQHPIVPVGDEELARFVQIATEVHSSLLTNPSYFHIWEQVQLNSAMQAAVIRALELGLSRTEIRPLLSLYASGIGNADYDSLIPLQRNEVVSGTFMVFHDLPYYLSTLHQFHAPHDTHLIGSDTDESRSNRFPVSFLTPPPDFRNRAVVYYEDPNTPRSRDMVEAVNFGTRRPFRFWDARTVSTEETTPNFQSSEFYAAHQTAAVSCLVEAHIRYRYMGSYRVATMAESEAFFDRLIVGNVLAYGPGNFQVYLQSLGVSGQTLRDAMVAGERDVPSPLPPDTHPRPASPTVNTDAPTPILSPDSEPQRSTRTHRITPISSPRATTASERRAEVRRRTTPAPSPVMYEESPLVGAAGGGMGNVQVIPMSAIEIQQAEAYQAISTGNIYRNLTSDPSSQ